MEFSIIVSFIILALSIIFAYTVHTLIKSRIADLIIVIVGFIICLLQMFTPLHWLIFAIGLIMGYSLETLGVYRKFWKYTTENGYSYWIGFGWAILVVTVYNTAFNPPFDYFILAILFVGSIVFVYKKSEMVFTEKRHIIEYIIKFLAFLLNPYIFTLVFAIALFIEYLGTEVFPIWEYPRTDYLAIGTSYGIFFVTLSYIKIWLTGTLDLQIYETIILILILLQHVLAVIKYLPFFNQSL
jgi:hypothetical protein